jgi:hypothetical protein
MSRRTVSLSALVYEDDAEELLRELLDDARVQIAILELGDGKYVLRGTPSEDT